MSFTQASSKGTVSCNNRDFFGRGRSGRVKNVLTDVNQILNRWTERWFISDDLLEVLEIKLGIILSIEDLT